MDEALLAFLETLEKLGDENDARETERSKRMLNITGDTGRLLWILVTAMRAERILEIGTSNAFSTIWLADAARATGGRLTSLELDRGKIALANANLATAGLSGFVEIIEGCRARSTSSFSMPIARATWRISSWCFPSCAPGEFWSPTTPFLMRRKCAATSTA